MSLWELFVIAVGLSMDAFAVAICKGLSVGRVRGSHAVTAGIYFGGFQMLMPLLGYLLGVRFQEIIAGVDQWIAFLLLGLIGANMIRESRVHAGGGQHDDSLLPPPVHAAGLAWRRGHQGIDALAVLGWGVTFAFLRVEIGPILGPGSLIIGVVIGIIIGLGSADRGDRHHQAPRTCGSGTDVGTIMQVVLTLKNLLGSLINFCVPLIIIGFIAPSITRLRSNASRMLALALALAYTSSGMRRTDVNGGRLRHHPRPVHPVGSGGAEGGAGAAVQPGHRPVMSVMSALVFSVLVGLAATWTQGQGITQVLEEFQRVVLAVVSRVVIPILPFFIAGTFCGLAYEGSITRQLPVFLIVILIVMVGHYLWLAVLYLLAGLYSGEKPWEVLRHYGPAYLTAVGTMSSAATLAAALEGARKSKVLRRDMVDFGIPLFANIHLCGSVLTEVFFVMTVSKVLYGELPSPMPQ